ncbi:DUF1513 domain-containing protein [Bordetella sp. 02P26C-1]|uniref:DUF1513 domain-containing protein n=1 Tax=Bordetella sp. 02P26C-1 TaxID=2683195 RepID=UPI001352E6A7|nr:DUF1513 domain-containing protein [Bordetella sp. 02P26C-1]MVW79728.1 DUF1513 domain-containing protein [Bordetella sp. 02P26C-1]
MEIDRRRFLTWAALTASGSMGLAATSAWAQVQGASADTRSGVQAPETGRLYLAARKAYGRYEAVVLDAQGRDQYVVPMPARGHSFALDPQRGRAVVFGRQPGFFAVGFSTNGSAEPQAIAAAEGRHFFGHGVYLPDGQLMLATENDYEAGQGVLGIYDASPGGAYRRIGEFSTGGIGPHEVVLLPDGKTLCVANGGILTHPDYGKLELNLDTMQPSLAYIDAGNGQLLERIALPPSLHQLSIRHLALAADGTVWFGCQHMGPASERPPLVGRHRRGQTPELFTGPDEVLRNCRNYIGSVAADPTGEVIATSSPVGNQVLYWNAADGTLKGVTLLADGCGVAPLAPARFLVNSGMGELVQAGPEQEAASILTRSSDLSWDNHFRRL